MTEIGAITRKKIGSARLETAIRVTGKRIHILDRTSHPASDSHNVSNVISITPDQVNELIALLQKAKEQASD